MLVINNSKKKYTHFPPQKALPNCQKNSRACVLSHVDNIHINRVFLMHILMLAVNPIAEGVLMIHLLIERPGFVHTTKVNKYICQASSFLLSLSKHN